ncbi:hypothetical protein SLW70_07650 [Flavobacterium sp. NG2]|uniref:hypothetical protein n=1 Tax=Flavobacterium sp. NG2 TaxID=3097547 RepID=UPI002A81F13A|nr:hypothetical protein [Flavobacterium sp. NG2]WPR72981.1 hypothetical protein SLW70_07650 [Flavobacterium sp. NG2]
MSFMSPDGSGILVAAGIYAATRYSGQQELCFPENAGTSAPKILKRKKDLVQKKSRFFDLKRDFKFLKNEMNYLLHSLILSLFNFT